MSSDYEDPTTWRLRVPNTDIPIRVVSREGSFEEEGAYLDEVYLIEADRLLDFAFASFPNVNLLDERFEYQKPLLAPGIPVVPRKVVWKAHVEGVPIDPFTTDDEAPEGTYSKIVEVKVSYTTGRTRENDPDNPSPFTFLEISADTSGEFIHSTAPNGKWAGSDEEGNPIQKLLTTPVSIVVPETQWSVTFTQIPHTFLSDPLMDRFRGALGKVNSSSIPLFFNAEPETVLFMGYSLNQQFTWRTPYQPPFKLSLKFVEKHIKKSSGAVVGHNHFWKADEGWTKLKFDGVHFVYEETDLNRLFAIL